MNNGQFNEESMFDTVENLFEVNLEKFSGITRLAAAVSRFHGFNQQIKLTSGVQKNVTTGKTQTKKATQESLLLLANIVRAALFALALELGNVELEKKMELSERQFRALRDPEQIDYAKTILAEALPFEKELEESGVTKAPGSWVADTPTARTPTRTIPRPRNLSLRLLALRETFICRVRWPPKRCIGSRGNWSIRLKYPL